MTTPDLLPTAPTVVVSGVASDSHTWNLVFLQLLVEELGYPVVNLGPCVPDEVLVERCRHLRPGLVVIGTVNGHGGQDALRVIERLRGVPELAATPVVIGGKLGVSGDVSRHTPALLAAGFDAVFEDGGEAIADFRRFVHAIPPAGRPALSGAAQGSEATA
ncbi:cobalamin B12-binding domain-containing protein [Saccharothrix luteola]|uniref:cobalamin B12-binding domain-containing protein n=1 Tax=Saccharothrix luteola TaxID=2893018 RepID=UPI001E4673C0|nr:cobalamin-dependent protein [Saccharothrix luteola]MCC8245575.1 methylaspartate mutase [Saccharothrix luteola]